jgi:small subunit ribosomal protein S4
LIKNNLKDFGFSQRPNHISFDNIKNEGKVLNFCNRNNILLNLNELLVVEYYSRR